MLKRISGFMMKIGTTVLLGIAYIVGIGVTSVFAKISGKKFLQNEIKNSSWIEIPEQSVTSTMY